MVHFQGSPKNENISLSGSTAGKSAEDGGKEISLNDRSVDGNGNSWYGVGDTHLNRMKLLILDFFWTIRAAISHGSAPY